LVDALYRERAGQTVQPADYVSRFPDLEPAWLEAALASTTSPSTIAPGGALCAPTVTAGRPAIPGLVLEKLLGAGGMGVVFKARQLKLDRDVAVKFLRDPHLADSAHGERFKQEARAVARLQHPNLVQLHEFGEVARADGAGTQPYLVLE